MESAGPERTLLRLADGGDFREGDPPGEWPAMRQELVCFELVVRGYEYPADDRAARSTMPHGQPPQRLPRGT